MQQPAFAARPLKVCQRIVFHVPLAWGSDDKFLLYQRGTLLFLWPTENKRPPEDYPERPFQEKRAYSPEPEQGLFQLYPLTKRRLYFLRQTQ